MTRSHHVTYFDSFEIEYIPKEYILKEIFIKCKHKIQCAHTFCIWFVDFMLKGKSLLNYTNLFYPNKYFKKYIKVILKYLQ